MQNAPKYRQFEHIFDVQGTCRWCRNLKPGANECWDVQHSFATGLGPLHDHTAPRSTKMKKNCFNSGSYLDSRESPATNQSWSSFFSFSLSEGLLGRVMAPDRAQMSAEHPSTHLHPVSGAYPTYMPPEQWKCADIGNIFMHLTSIKWSNLVTGFLQK